MPENHFTETTHPIDVVIAWVDGNDQQLTAKRNRYLPKTSDSISSGAHSTRFASSNEIRYCVLSILRFAPFVRNIFIVTDEQDPELYDDIKKYFPGKLDSLKIVDHKEIFEGFEKYLPTFNSISIASMIWRIKGLSENFVYFNDDTFLIRSFKPEDWFINNKPVIRGKWVPAPAIRDLWNNIRIIFNRYLSGNTDFKPRASFHLGQWRSASLLGFKMRYFTNSHTPHTVSRKIIEEFFSKNRELLEKNISYRFRDHSQFTFISLSNHLQLLDGNRHIARPALVYLKPQGRTADYVDKKIRLCETSPGIKYLCIQSLDMCRKEDQDRLFGWLDKVLQIGQD